MSEVKDFFTRSQIMLNFLTAPLSITLVLVFLAGCAGQPRHHAAASSIDQEQDTASANVDIGEVRDGDQSLLVEAEMAARSSVEEDADLDATSDTPLVALIDPELTRPDAEHITVDSNDEEPGEDGIDSSADAADTMAQDTDAEDASGIVENNLWDRIRQGFSLEDSEEKRTVAEREWYANHQAYLDRTIERAQPYLHLIVEEAERLNVPSELVLLPIVESAFQPFAYSHGRAAGIWQFIPSTGRLYGLKQNWWYDGRRDIDASTRAALKYLSNLSKSFDNDWLLALAAYNSGQGTVRNAIKHNLRRGKGTDFWSLNLPRETRAYVPKLLALRAIINDPEQYGVRLKPIADKPYLTKVDTNTQIDLALAADLAGISLEELYRLNPAFNRWATAPTGPHNLLVPIDRAEDFNHKLAELPESERIKWARHKVKSGENLGLIANKYHTTVNMLRQVNKIHGHMIRAGSSLIIPVATKKMNNYTLSAMQRRHAIQNTPKHGNKLHYRVRKGDSLWNIARHYGVSVNTLAKWNGIAPRDVLREGQRLVIWVSYGKTESPTSIQLATSATTQRINYIVRNGDSLARISQRFKVKISELRRWNALPENRYLQPGQRLKLYVDVTRQSENI